MYRYDARVTPDAEGFKDALAAWAEGGYAASGAPPPLDVPPEASALDWLRRGALQKLAEVRQALETQASGSHWGGGEKGGRLRPALLHRHPLLLPHLLTPPPHPSALPCALLRLPSFPQDHAALARTLLPVLLLCLLGLGLMLASAVAAKKKRD